LRRNENVFAFSLAAASLEVLQLLSMVVVPGGVANAGAQMHHFVTGTIDRDEGPCNDNCCYKSLVARGDRAGPVVTRPHRAAEEARRQRQAARRPEKRGLLAWLRRWLPW
jgi:hypothetical protein